MLGRHSLSRSLRTIRRACEAVNMVFSFGGLQEEAAVGLRRRSRGRGAALMGAEEGFAAETRLMAVRIFRTSFLEAFHG